MFSYKILSIIPSPSVPGFVLIYIAFIGVSKVIFLKITSLMQLWLTSGGTDPTAIPIPKCTDIFSTRIFWEHFDILLFSVDGFIATASS